MSRRSAWSMPQHMREALGTRAWSAAHPAPPLSDYGTIILTRARKLLTARGDTKGLARDTDPLQARFAMAKKQAKKRGGKSGC